MLPKIKMLFIQHLYNLSDPELEDQVHDRLSFQRFCGLSLSDEIVDFTTLWRLKERMVKANVDQNLFNQINEELDRKGLFVKKGTIANPKDSFGRASPTLTQALLNFPTVH